MAVPEGITREQYADAVTQAVVLEDDWLTLRLFIDSPETRWPAYKAECRAKLMAAHGWCPYPFDEV